MDTYTIVSKETNEWVDGVILQSEDETTATFVNESGTTYTFTKSENGYTSDTYSISKDENVDQAIAEEEISGVAADGSTDFDAPSDETVETTPEQA